MGYMCISPCFIGNEISFGGTGSRFSLCDLPRALLIYQFVTCLSYTTIHTSYTTRLVFWYFLDFFSVVCRYFRSYNLLFLFFLQPHRYIVFYSELLIVFVGKPKFIC